MSAFHTIAVPHDDILQGRLTMDVFAADLWEVYKGRGPEEYTSPEVFFAKTYQTEGLANLLNVVWQRLQGQGGDPVIQVQTPFGGGKTHALIAMYHRAAEWGTNRVVFVGTPMSATDTPWAVFEEQLTGRRERFAGLDAPGRDALRDLLEPYQPLLILIDELLEYVVKAAGRLIGDTTLAAQTMAFLQELTELAGTMEQLSLVVTLPASVLEHYDENAERLFHQLQRIAGRVEKIYTPVQEHEITRVIRQRLFSRLDEKKMSRVISQFMDYAVQESLLPAGVEPSEYRQRFEASYPFLPEVIDVLYHRWGSFSTFQRTRGVLRLLALVVHALKDENLPYITLADFDLANQDIRRELLKHIGPEYDSVIAQDITSPESAARKVNTELGRAYQGLNLGSRVATTIFMHSFSGGAERGALLPEIKRNATTLDNPSSAVSEAVEQFKGLSFFMQPPRAGKYYFTNQPNLNRMVLTRMENIDTQQIAEMEYGLLRKLVKGDRLKVAIAPEDPATIPDTAEMKLVIVYAVDEGWMQGVLDKKGDTPRVNRNTIFFLAPIDYEREALWKLIREHLAYRSLRDDLTLPLTSEQNKEISDHLKDSEDALKRKVREAYRLLFIPGRDGLKRQDMGIPTYGDAKPLDSAVYDKLRLDGEILENIAPLVIKERYLQDRDYVLTEQLYLAGFRTPGQNRVLSADAWQRGIAEGVRKGLFGLGELEGDQPVCRYFKEEPSTSLAGSEVLIRAELCQPAKPVVVGPTPGGSRAVDDEGYQPGFGDFTPPPAPGPTVGEGTINQLRLHLTVPKGRVADLGGVMNLLQRRFGHMEITLLVQDGTLSEQEYEDKIREAFRQMGVQADEEIG